MAQLQAGEIQGQTEEITWQSEKYRDSQTISRDRKVRYRKRQVK